MKTQQTMNGKELPQPNTEYLQKNLQLTYLIVKNGLVSPIRLRTRQGCPYLPVLFDIILKILADVIIQEK